MRIFAVVTLVLALLGVGLASIIDADQRVQSAPLATANCFVSASPISPAIDAPSDLEAEHFFFSGRLGIWEVVRWQDNADNETCYVVEKSGDGATFQPIAVLPANAECLLDKTESLDHGWFYRVYAATETERSAYSNEDGGIFIIDTFPPPSPPTPTQPPTPTPLPGCYVYGGELSTPVPTPETPYPTPFQTAPARGDINCDGSVNALDALPILQHDAGFTPNLPASCPPLN